MRYLPKSPADRTDMLEAIGVPDIESLFETIPAEYRLTRDLEIPRQHSESEVLERFRAFGANIASGSADELAIQPASKLFASFLGAGSYRHYRPVIIDSLVQRGEFLTSYTPYQPEIAQGTLQAMFEFQTMICELTGMEIANASMYDGSTGAAEAVLMACRVTGRQGAVVARTVHPEYREVLATVTQHQGIPITETGYVAATGRVDLKALDAAITSETAAVLIQSPNFFGTIEDVAAIAEIAHAKGALLIVSIAEAVSLGVVKAPVEADIVSLEAQSFGVAVGFGGPYCGVIACKEKFLRQMPGRLVGETKDMNGKRGFVLTLSTREQHIRREKATSNICTNQALVALMVTIFMTVYGKQGLRELAEQNLAKAAYLRDALLKSGAETKFDGTPRFHEFVLTTAEPAEALNARLLDKHIIGGLALAKWYPELGKNATLWCATELMTKAQMDAAATVLADAAHAEPELVGGERIMDVSALEGQELSAVEFVTDHLRLCFDGPVLTLYAWPHVLLSDFSVAFGEPEYRNALCAQIGEMVATASLEEMEALTVEFESGTVIALSLREEELSGPQAGSYSADGSGSDEEEF